MAQKQSNTSMQATDGFSIVPDDALTIAQQVDNTQGYESCMLYTGSGGSISVVFVDGKTVDFTDVPPGVDKPWRVKQVRATGTTATGIKGLIGKFG